ncbi:MAG: hypothetical protein K9L74_06750 [Candidatus Izimaplasma sp.]|nr:hypothetical protein [Candidatus Izimaplasma bacterium]
MNKGIIIKASIMLGFFAVVLGLAYGCSVVKDNEKTPMLSNPDDVYLTVNDITVTNQDLWDLMKVKDGLNYLTQYTEEEMLKDTITSLTDDEIEEMITLMIYGTLDEYQLQEIKDDPELDEDYQEQFRQSLVVLGFDASNPEDRREFAELATAKRKVTKEYILNANSDDELAVTAEKVESYYTDNYQGNSCVLDVRFSSNDEANLVLKEFNLVPNFEGGLGKYIGSDPIEDVAVDDFTLDNTVLLDEDAAFNEYIKLYNYMNPSDSPIAESIEYADFCANYADEFNHNFEEMGQGRSASEPIMTFRNYIFNILGLGEDDQRYAYQVQSVGNFSVLAFKITENDAPDFEDLTANRVAEIRDEYVDTQINQANITKIINQMKEEIEFELFDPIFKLQYEFNNQTDSSFDNDGSATVVATFGDLEITVDELFDYMAGNIGTYYSIELVKSRYLINSQFYEDTYGDNKDFLENKSDKMVEHRNELRTMKQTFSANGYQQYGFSSEEFTWKEFLVLAFGAENESDVIRDLFVVGSLQPYMVVDTIAYEQAEDFIQDQFDNYFSLNTKHLLLYLDLDKDFTPDDFDEYLENLSEAEHATYNSLKIDFQNLILDRIDAGKSLKEIEAEFQDSLIGDETNEFAKFKAAGFYIMQEDLVPPSSQQQQQQQQQQKTSLNYNNTKAFDEAFVDGLKRIYDDYVAAKNSSAEEMNEYYDDQLTQSSFGLHYLHVSEGDNFDQPMAQFNNEGSYSDGSSNESNIPNKSQVNLYIEIKFAGLTGTNTDEILPDNVYKSLENYYRPLLDAYYSSTGYSIVATEFLLDNNVEYTLNDSENINYLENLLDEFYSINFPEEFIR